MEVASVSLLVVNKLHLLFVFLNSLSQHNLLKPRRDFVEMEVASVSLLVVNKLPALQALALDYAENEEDFVSFLMIGVPAYIVARIQLSSNSIPTW